MANQYLTGSGGNVWINGQILTTLKDIEIKISLNFDDEKNCGSYSTEYSYTGWTGEGKMTINKINSMALKLLNDATENGVMPDIKVISKLTDKATGKSERTAISSVVFTEYALAKFEAGATVIEELPFKFSEKQVLETL